MGGRLEYELRVQNKLQEKIDKLPKVFSEYYYSLISSGKTYTTAYRYIEHVLRFVTFTFGENYADDFYLSVTGTHVNMYITSLRTKETNGKVERTSDSHRALHWSAINSFFQFLVPQYITINPVSYTNKPKVRDNPNVTYLTREEVGRFLKNVEAKANERMKNRDLCIFKLGFGTGLRVSAITQIDIKDVDLEHNQIKVTEKGDRDYYVLIGDNLRAQIILWLQDREKYFGDVDSDALFLSQKRKRISTRTIGDLIERYNEGVTDKHVSPHVMRHSCATNLYEAKGDIYLCAEQLHHRNVSTTQRYAEVSKERKKNAANILDDMI